MNDTITKTWQALRNREWRILMLEGTPADAELVVSELRKAGLSFTSMRVETRDAFMKALEEFHPDIVLSDYKLSDFPGMDVLKIVKHDHPEVPVVMVTGLISDLEAVDMIHAGAKDCVLKDRLVRLAPTVQRALSSEQGTRARKAAEKMLQESEARYRRITEGLTDYQYTVRIDKGHAVETTQSSACEKVTGYRAEEFAADPYLWIQMIAPEDRELVTANVQQILAGKDVPPMEHRIVRKDGVISWVSDTTILFKDTAGTLLSYDGVIKDITERKQAEVELRKSRDELEVKVFERTAELQAVNTSLLDEKVQREELISKLAEAHSQLIQSEKMASIGQLAAGVAHEINNPIGFVNSNLGALKHYIEDLLTTLSVYEESEGEMTEVTRERLTELKRKVDIAYLRKDVGNLLSESMEGMQRVKRIIQDLKDFSHVDETGTQLANLEQGLDSTLNVVWNELEFKVEVVKEYGGIAEIECIPSQLNQVFMNLLMNAVQAIKEHGTITLRTGQEGDNVWIEVEDNGEGIKPEHMGRIFDPFFTTKPVGAGTGLGLSLSYGIVQNHGGRFEVKSEVGKGTVFRVILPLGKREG
jgi:PAS domain S-box-containing protein